MADRFYKQKIADREAEAIRREERERCARLVRDMIDMRPWDQRTDARMALAIAESTIKRGRHLTDAEKANNLAKAIEEDGDQESVELANRIRASVGLTATANESEV